MRPLPATLIGYYQILLGLLKGLLGLTIFAFAGLAAKLASLAAEGNAMERFLHISGHIAGFVVLAWAACHLLAGYGVLQMQNWGRLLTLLFSAMGLAFLLPFLHGGLPLIFAAINAATILYLILPATKRLFQSHDEDRPVRAAA